MGFKVVVIIPTFNEEQTLGRCIDALHGANSAAADASVTIVVSDGGSSDRTAQVASSKGAIVLGKARDGHGRGAQLAHAVEYATSNSDLAAADILLFLHADVLIEASIFLYIRNFFFSESARACSNTDDVATFRIAFNIPEDASFWRKAFFWVCEGWCFNWDGLYHSFGDQGIAVRPSTLHRAGGFPRWPLFEDVEFLRRVRNLSGGRVLKLDSTVTTSIRRFDLHGDLNYAARCWVLITLFFFGASPEWLSALYGPRREPKKSNY